MAGDWIKMRSDLTTHPKVVRIMSALKADKLRTIGGLHSAWCLFDTHSSDGILKGYTTEVMDDYLGWPGFSSAMVSIGWLEEINGSLVMPNFAAHNGQSAKRRAQDADRKMQARNVRDSSASDADILRTREEKRREEKKEHKDTLRFDFAKALISSGVDPQVAADYIATRKAKKCVQTETAFNLLVNESAKACLSLADAVSVCCKRGWGGFEASWIKPEDRPKSSAASCDPRSAEVIILPDGRRVTQAGIELMRRMM